MRLILAWQGGPAESVSVPDPIGTRLDVGKDPDGEDVAAC